LQVVKEASDSVAVEATAVVTPCIRGLRDRNPVEIALAEQSAPVLRQKGVFLKHRITSEGPTNPPAPRRGRQIVN
jgi:hypothetical protein